MAAGSEHIRNGHHRVDMAAGVRADDTDMTHWLLRTDAAPSWVPADMVAMEGVSLPDSTGRCELIRPMIPHRAAASLGPGSGAPWPASWQRRHFTGAEIVVGPDDLERAVGLQRSGSG